MAIKDAAASPLKKASESGRAGKAIRLQVDIDPLVRAVSKHARLSAAQLRSIRSEFSRLLVGPFDARITTPQRHETIAANKALEGPDEVLSTEAAARLVGVSRPYFVKLVDSGRIALYQRVGKHRRVLRSAVLQWQVAERSRQAKALKAFARSLDEEIAS
jgi:excisionase family DNA binding protein